MHTAPLGPGPLRRCRTSAATCYPPWTLLACATRSSPNILPSPPSSCSSLQDRADLSPKDHHDFDPVVPAKDEQLWAGDSQSVRRGSYNPMMDMLSMCLPESLPARRSLSRSISMCILPWQMVTLRCQPATIADKKDHSAGQGSNEVWYPPNARMLHGVMTSAQPYASGGTARARYSRCLRLVHRSASMSGRQRSSLRSQTCPPHKNMERSITTAECAKRCWLRDRPQ